MSTSGCCTSKSTNAQSPERRPSGTQPKVKKGTQKLSEGTIKLKKDLDEHARKKEAADGAAKQGYLPNIGRGVQMTREEHNIPSWRK